MFDSNFTAIVLCLLFSQYSALAYIIVVADILHTLQHASESDMIL